jgi:TolA-binding protein
MKSVLGLLALALFAAGVIWVVVGINRYRARKRAEAQREAAFLAELASAATRKGKPPAPAAAPARPSSSPAAAPANPRAAVPASAASLPPASPPTPAAAIKGALSKGDAETAARLFVQHAGERTTLKLAPAEWEPLGRALLKLEAYMEAAWALHAGALLAGDAAGAQQRLIDVATRASASGRAEVALRLYQTLLAKYPASEFAELARAGIGTEQKKLGKA